MSLPCKQLNKENSKGNVFEPTCATVAFKKNLTSWDNIKGKYLSHINEINDPILKYISFYFVQYYIDGYYYYKDSIINQRSEACRYLIGWLQEKKDLFTFGETCKRNLNLWEKNFESLWSMLKSDYTISENNPKPWCDNYKLFLLTKFPPGATPPNCEETSSQEPNSKAPLLKEITKDCICPENGVADRSQITENTPETDRSKNLAVTSGFTAFGTLGTLLVLYKFTPMSSWLRRRGMNNVGSDLYMDPGAAESFLRMQNDNGSNNLFYQP